MTNTSRIAVLFKCLRTGQFSAGMYFNHNALKLLDYILFALHCVTMDFNNVTNVGEVEFRQVKSLRQKSWDPSLV